MPPKLFWYVKVVPSSVVTVLPSPPETLARLLVPLLVLLLDEPLVEPDEELSAELAPLVVLLLSFLGLITAKYTAITTTATKAATAAEPIKRARLRDRLGAAAFSLR